MAHQVLNSGCRGEAEAKSWAWSYVFMAQLVGSRCSSSLYSPWAPLIVVNANANWQQIRKKGSTLFVHQGSLWPDPLNFTGYPVLRERLHIILLHSRAFSIHLRNLSFLGRRKKQLRRLWLNVVRNRERRRLSTKWNMTRAAAAADNASSSLALDITKREWAKTITAVDLIVLSNPVCIHISWKKVLDSRDWPGTTRPDKRLSLACPA